MECSLASGEIELIAIRAGDLVVEIAPRIGGSIARFYSDLPTGKKHWFRPLEENYFDPRQVLNMGGFALAPYSNRIRDGLLPTVYDPLQLPLNCLPDPHPCHGTGWQTGWQVIQQSQGEIVMQHETGPDFPVQYRVEQRILLRKNSLCIELILKNTCEQSFAAGLGYHPYFLDAANAYLIADVPGEWVLDENSMPTHFQFNGKMGAFQYGQPVTELCEMTAFCGWDGKAGIGWYGSDDRMSIKTSAHMEHLLIWNPADQDIFCVEPATHTVDGFALAAKGHQATGNIMLKPGQTMQHSVTFTPGTGAS